MTEVSQTPSMYVFGKHDENMQPYSRAELWWKHMKIHFLKLNVICEQGSQVRSAETLFMALQRGI